MSRIKRGVTTRAKHKRVLEQAKGYYGRRKNTIRIAKQAVEKAGQYAYRDRKVKKRNFRGPCRRPDLFAVHARREAGWDRARPQGHGRPRDERRQCLRCDHRPGESGAAQGSLTFFSQAERNKGGPGGAALFLWICNDATDRKPPPVLVTSKGRGGAERSLRTAPTMVPVKTIAPPPDPNSRGSQKADGRNEAQKISRLFQVPAKPHPSGVTP